MKFKLRQGIYVSLSNLHHIDLWLSLVVKMGECAWNKSLVKTSKILVMLHVNTFCKILLPDELVGSEVKHLLKLLSGQEGVGVHEVVSTHRSGKLSHYPLV